MKKLLKLFRIPYVQFFIFAVVAFSFPYLNAAGLLPSYHLTHYGFTLIFAIAALGLNLLLGYSGLASLGTAGFIGLSGFMTISLVHDFSLPYFAAFGLAILIPLLLGVIVGFISLRISGMYLAIATLIVGEILRYTFVHLHTFTGGATGRTLDYPVIFGFQFNRAYSFMLVVIVLFIMMVITQNIIRGRTGRALVALRGSTSAAQAMGINLVKYRLLAFTLATIYASVAGVMWASFATRILPSDWSLALSLNLLAVVVIGGLKSIWGTLIGAYFVRAFPQIVLANLPIVRDIRGVAYAFTGIMIVLILMFYPYGLVYASRDVKKVYLKIKHLIQNQIQKRVQNKGGKINEK